MDSNLKLTSWTSIRYPTRDTLTTPVKKKKKKRNIHNVFNLCLWT